MISGYLEKIEQTDALHSAAQAAATLHPCKTEEDWFGRWLGFLAMTCPGPLSESCEGKSLDTSSLPLRRLRRDGV